MQEAEDQTPVMLVVEVADQMDPGNNLRQDKNQICHRIEETHNLKIKIKCTDNRDLEVQDLVWECHLAGNHKTNHPDKCLPVVETFQWEEVHKDNHPQVSQELEVTLVTCSEIHYLKRSHPSESIE